MWLRSLLLISYAAVAIGQTAADLPATIDGQVVNSLTGEAISGASVSLVVMRRTRGQLSAAVPAVTSNRDGTFHMEQVPPGTYYAQVRQSGFTTPPRSSARLLVVKPGASLNDVSLTLVPESILAGVVVDELGAAVSGIEVLALATVSRSGVNSLEVRSQSVTDKAGSFRLQRLRPGSYYLVAKPDSKNKGQGQNDFALTAYPRSLEIEGATPLPVTAGQSETGLRLTLRKAASHVVQGRIAESITDSSLRVVLALSGSVRAEVLNKTVQAASDGTFRFLGVLPGSYTLRLMARKSHLVARTDLQMGAADVLGIVLTPAAPITLTGTLRADPPPASSGLPMVQVIAHSSEAPANAVSVLAGSGGSGTFAVEGLEPLAYTFFTRVQGSPGWYVKSIAVNRQDAQNRIVDLTGGGAGTIDIVVAQGAAEVDGTIADAPADSNMGVVLAPDQPAPDGSDVLATYAQAAQPFTFRNVPPGRYNLYAIPLLQINLWQNPDFLRAMSPHALTVTVKENDRLQVEPSLTAQELIDQAAEQLALNPE